MLIVTNLLPNHTTNDALNNTMKCYYNITNKNHHLVNCNHSSVKNIDQWHPDKKPLLHKRLNDKLHTFGMYH